MLIMVFSTAKVRLFPEYTKYFNNYFAYVSHFFIYKVCSAGRTNIRNIQNIQNIHAPVIGLCRTISHPVALIR